jgi:hypothetical protein
MMMARLGSTPVLLAAHDAAEAPLGGAQMAAAQVGGDVPKLTKELDR